MFALVKCICREHSHVPVFLLFFYSLKKLILFLNIYEHWLVIFFPCWSKEPKSFILRNSMIFLGCWWKLLLVDFGNCEIYFSFLHSHFSTFFVSLMRKRCSYFIPALVDFWTSFVRLPEYILLDLLWQKQKMAFFFHWPNIWS